jgi:MFS family permease
MWLLAGLATGFVILWFIIALVIAIWLYRDAEDRGQSGVLWLIVALIAGIFGLIIWLLVRPPKPKKKKPKKKTNKKGGKSKNTRTPLDYVSTSIPMQRRKK